MISHCCQGNHILAAEDSLAMQTVDNNGMKMVDILIDQRIKMSAIKFIKQLDTA
jgi:hypothetical protein